eukprot:g9467.t1
MSTVQYCPLYRNHKQIKIHTLVDEVYLLPEMGGPGSGGRNRRAVMCVDTGACFPSVMEAARRHNMCEINIYNALSGRQKKAGGLTWKYLTQAEKEELMTDMADCF